MQKKRARERIIMFLCIISLLFTPVLAASQSNAMRVSLDLKSATVKEFFDAVKVQTGLNFIYSTEQVKNMPRITIQSNSQPISEVLNKVLANTGYSYEIEGNIVTIVYQQPKENVRTATGVVVDEGGLPLPGAYIKLSKTEHSTITDNEGKFSINFAPYSVAVETIILSLYFSNVNNNLNYFTVTLSPFLTNPAFSPKGFFKNASRSAPTTEPITSAAIYPNTFPTTGKTNIPP